MLSGVIFLYHVLCTSLCANKDGTGQKSQEGLKSDLSLLSGRKNNKRTGR